MSTTTTTPTTRSRFSQHVQREFVMVPFGGSARSAHAKSSTPLDETRPTISCDGRVSGVTMELTHWTDNQTPDTLYADTSTEMALKLATAVCRVPRDPAYDYLKDALVLNNHYDTDGLASTFACLEPELALEHDKLLLSAAEAGDFGEWNSHAGVQLNLALEAWLEQHSSKDEELAYHSALQMMPYLLHDFETNHGNHYQHLWSEAWNQVQHDYEYLSTNLDQLILPAIPCPADMAIVVESSESSTSISCYAIYRALKESGHWSDQMGISGSGPIRILRAKPSSFITDDGGGLLFSYNYEMIGHGWVQRLVQRRPCPSVPKVEDLVNELNGSKEAKAWKKGGVSGLVSLCQTTHPVQTAPQDMAARLATLDPALNKMLR